MSVAHDNQTVNEKLSPATPVHPGSLRVTVIEPRSGFAGLSLSEVWEYRDLLFTLAQRDVKLRYRQTAVGIVWVVLQPLLTSLILAFVFGVLGKFKSGDVPYVTFALAGNIGFMVFSSTLMKANMSLIQNSNLVSKIYFPRIILPLSTAFSSLIDFFVAFGLMVIFLISFRIVPTFAILLLPVWILILLTMAIGIGLYIAALTVSYRDVQYVTPIFVQLLTFATPVGYSVATAQVPGWARPFWSLNPLSGLMEAMRWSFLGKGMPPPSGASIAYSAIFATVVLIGGAFAFRNMERRFADVI